MDNDAFRLRLIDGWQRDFPLIPEPFEQLAKTMGVEETSILLSLRELQGEGVLTRVGAVVRPNTLSVSTLAAMKVPVADLVNVARIVSREPGVNHNYEREHEFNLWFVASARDQLGLDQLLRNISAQTGIETISLPLHRAHHIDLGFSLCPPNSQSAADEVRQAPCTVHNERQGAMPPPTITVDELDHRLLAAIEDGLPLVSRPYAMVARQLGVSESEIIARLKRLVEGWVISRFGFVVRHRKIGFKANAMAVWDIDEADVDALGDLLASKSFVTLCYQRIRVQPVWPYNLFCMIHGHERSNVLAQVEELNQIIGSRALAHTVLFSRNCFKQRGARFSLPRSEPGASEAGPVELSLV